MDWTFNLVTANKIFPGQRMAKPIRYRRRELKLIKMKQVTINLYSFLELNQDAQQKAIREHSEFMAIMPVQCENNNGELEDIYEEYSDEDIVDNILANDYVFFEDGKLASCTTYTGKHPKSGTTELKFHGRIYDITK